MPSENMKNAYPFESKHILLTCSNAFRESHFNLWHSGKTPTFQPWNDGQVLSTNWPSHSPEMNEDLLWYRVPWQILQCTKLSLQLAGNWDPGKSHTVRHSNRLWALTVSKKDHLHLFCFVWRNLRWSHLKGVQKSSQENWKDWMWRCHHTDKSGLMGQRRREREVPGASSQV